MFYIESHKPFIIKYIEFNSGTISMSPSSMQPLVTHVDKLVTSNFQVCFPSLYLSSNAKYSHMANMPEAELALVSPTLAHGVLETYRICANGSLKCPC